MDKLISKIEKLIKYEKITNPDIQYLTPEHAGLIAQIISNYKLKEPTSQKPSAQMIFLGAPTGAGKDTLVRKIMTDNPDENFVVLNMDMFRTYHNVISGNEEPISDKNYARATNQSSYELYYIIQELILREFPGTSVIVTGTMTDLDWVKEIATRYKLEPSTDYKISLVTLAVPIKESAFSIFERYLNMVNARGDSTSPLRYTDLKYHNDTINGFTQNLHTLEDELHAKKDKSLFKSIRVYRRSTNILDLSEDTLIYDSTSPLPDRCAFTKVYEIMHSSSAISQERIDRLYSIIEANAEYLKTQNLYDSIKTDLNNIIFDQRSNEDKTK